MKPTINYKPIKGQRKGSYTALTIYPPGAWFKNTDYQVFVGGCGHGARPTLKEAESFLLFCAQQYCERRIAEAKKTEIFYRKALAKLVLKKQP